MFNIRRKYAIRFKEKLLRNRKVLMLARNSLLHRIDLSCSAINAPALSEITKQMKRVNTCNLKNWLACAPALSHHFVLFFFPFAISVSRGLVFWHAIARSQTVSHGFYSIWLTFLQYCIMRSHGVVEEKRWRVNAMLPEPNWLLTMFIVIVCILWICISVWCLWNTK